VRTSLLAADLGLTLASNKGGGAYAVLRNRATNQPLTSRATGQYLTSRSA